MGEVVMGGGRGLLLFWGGGGIDMGRGEINRGIRELLIIDMGGWSY